MIAKEQMVEFMVRIQQGTKRPRRQEVFQACWPLEAFINVGGFAGRDLSTKLKMKHLRAIIETSTLDQPSHKALQVKNPPMAFSDDDYD